MSAGSGAAVLNWPLGGSFVTSRNPRSSFLQPLCRMADWRRGSGGGAFEAHGRGARVACPSASPVLASLVCAGKGRGVAGVPHCPQRNPVTYISPYSFNTCPLHPPINIYCALALGQDILAGLGPGPATPGHFPSHGGVIINESSPGPRFPHLSKG